MNRLEHNQTSNKPQSPLHSSRNLDKRKILLAIFLFTLFVALSVFIYLNPLLQADINFSRYLQAQPVFSFLLTANLVFDELFFRTLLVILIAIALIKQRFRFAVIFSFILVSEGLSFIVKRIVMRPRPTEAFVEIMRDASGFAYISGHTLEYTLFFGFLAILVWRSRLQPAVKALIVLGCLIVPVIVALGRVYVGQHWLTDTMGSMLLAGAILVMLRQLVGNAGHDYVGIEQ